MRERDYDGMVAVITKAEAGGALSPKEQTLLDEAQQLIAIVRITQPLTMLNRIAQQIVQQRGIRTDGQDLHRTMNEMVTESPLSQAAAGILVRLLNDS